MLKLIACLILCLILMAVTNVEAGMSESKLICETIAREGFMRAGKPYMDDYIAIARTIRNRLLLKWDGETTIHGIILHPMAFSAWNPGVEMAERTKEQLEAASLAWELSAIPADFPATHYHLADMKEYPSWAGKIKYLCQVGKHKFYQEVRQMDHLEYLFRAMLRALGFAGIILAIQFPESKLSYILTGIGAGGGWE